MPVLSALDWVILGIVGFSALVSVIRGFVKEASSLLSWIVAFIVASRFYSLIGSFLTFSDDKLTRNVIAVILLFVITLIVVGFISKFICSLVKKAGLSGFDRLLGIAFGAVRGILIVSACLALFHMLFRFHILSFIMEYDWYKNSLFIPELNRVVEWFFSFMATPEFTGA